jgi:hypothetical protein
MPEVTIYEDCDLLLRKDYVGGPIQPLTVSLKAQTDPPKLPLNQQL